MQVTLSCIVTDDCCVVREKRLSLRKITDLETDGCIMTFDALTQIMLRQTCALERHANNVTY